ncbi:MAG TPA: T9SS type A sorting domain-containing protein [Saprospiraceae bacterium]|nr:T9SS type A sorting domain-containing protein [Saprospiraceae bacterium]
MKLFPVISALLLSVCLLPYTFSQSILLFEDFETGDFEAKGWYDGFPDQRTTAEYRNGTHSYAGHFAQGATTSGAGRHLFAPTDKVYISYWVKYSSNYVGSGVGYHPHEWSFLTNKDWIYQGPADTYLTTYIEQNAGRPLLALQDSKNVDPDCILLNNNSFVGCNGDFNTYPFTEDRSVCACNGLIGDLDKRDCFASPGSTHGYYSARSWHADSVYFRDSPGTYYKNDWHFIEAYFELNDIVEDEGIPNGKIRYWYDGQLLISSDSILMRTATHPDMQFNQLFYGPYIGVGSPVDQTWWVDDLTIADGILTTGAHTPSLPKTPIELYPNPTTGLLTIEIPGITEQIQEYDIEIFDTPGKLVYRQTIHSNRETLILNLSEGIYYCCVKSSMRHYGVRKMRIDRR